MTRRRLNLIAMTAAWVGIVLPVHAADSHLDVELKYFGSICVANAPSFSAEDIHAAGKALVATKIKLGPGSNFTSSKGKACGATFRWKGENLSPVPEAKVKPMVQAFAERMGASDVVRAAEQGGNALKYTVKTEKYQFTLTFEVKGSERLYSISKHK